MNVPTNPWLSPRDLLPCTGVRLFCLPHAGSGAAGFFRWKRLLGPGIEVCPVLLPGREMRLAEPSAEHAVTLASDLLSALDPLLDQPFALFGHSMGALLAYECARQLELSGRATPRWLFVSARAAPHPAFAHRQLHQLADEPFVQALRQRYGGISDDFLADPDLREVFLPILRADLRLVETYEVSTPRPLTCPIFASAGDTDASVSPEGLEAWRDLTSARCECLRLPGDHFYHLGTGQAQLLAAIEARLMA